MVSVPLSAHPAQSDLGPLAPLRAVWRHRRLIRRLARSELEGRFRGSLLGMAWMAVNPLIMLVVYTFVFTVVFRARWGAGDAGGGSMDFALFLFSGMIVFGVLAECLNRAPTLLLENVSYIKRVVFPLEILPVVVLGTALVNAAISFVILILFHLAVRGAPPLTALLAPLALAPLCLVALGASWFLASVGVFLRDIRQMVGVLVTLLMFLSPIFYPLDALPPAFRFWAALSPLTLILEQSKDLLFWGRLPDPLTWALTFIVSWGVAWLGYVWFAKTRKGFADVV